jgi:hypothetical protein
LEQKCGRIGIDLGAMLLARPPTAADALELMQVAPGVHPPGRPKRQQ